MDHDALDAKFAALADPTRRAILARLASGEATLSVLAEPLAMTKPGVAKHLDVLERAGLIARGERSAVRPIRIEPAAFSDLSRWIDGCRRHWESSFDRLAAHLDVTAPGRDAS